MANHDPRWLLALAWLAGFTLIDSSIVSLALPDIAEDFDRSVGQLAWVSTAYLLTLAATLLAAGRLADRYGQRPVLAAGATVFGLATLACGLAPTFEALIAARLLQGVAGGVLYTVSLAITVTAFPPERRASAIGIYFTSGALGAVIGPVVGGFLTDLGGWRLVFLAQLPLPAIVAAGAIVLLPAMPRRSGPFDVAGIGAASAFIAASTFGMLQLAEPEGGAMAGLAAVVAIAALVAFVVVERRTEHPAVRLGIFGNARFVVATAAGAAAWFSIMSGVIYPAIYLQLGRDMSPALAGVILLSAPLVALVAFPFGGRIVAAVGLDAAMLLGVVVMAAGAGLVLTWDATTPTWWIVASQLVSGAGVALTLVASATDAMAQFAPEDAGTGSAVFNSLRQLGAAMGVAVPAVAFELVAGGSRSTEAALAGSSSAFLIRVVVLALPVLAVLVPRFASRRPTSGEPDAQIIAIDHVQLAMPPGGEGAARGFYAGVLGLRDVSKPAALMGRGGCWFASSDGAAAVHLGIEDDFRPARKAHPAFAVADLDILRRRLADAGAEIVEDDSIGVRRLYTADPFGNRIELVATGDAGFTQHDALASDAAARDPS